MLPDHELRRLCKDQGLVSPMPDDVQFQPASIDLRLDDRFTFQDGREVRTSRFELLPGEVVLASTIEKVSIPSLYAARVEGRSSLGRKFMLAHAAAGFVDPGFSGHITLELVNAGKQSIVLERGMRIAQLCVHQLTSECERPYGSRGLGSKYQNEQGATLARDDVK